jgi:hypothetical protein
MSIGRFQKAWQRRVDVAYRELVDELPALIRDPDYRHVARAYSSTVVDASLVVPGRVRKEVAALSDVVEKAVAEQQAAVKPTESLGLHVVSMFHLANALQCVGVHIAKATMDTIATWLPRVRVKRDDAEAEAYWSTGYAALALDARPTYRRFTGGDDSAELPFKAGETFGFNLQGLLRHFAAAVEQRQPASAVKPAWDELLENFDTHWDADSITEGTLLWMARIVYHRIGGHELGSVSKRLHDEIERYVGK